MCGIAGGVNINANLELLHNSLKHRGPDDFGVFQKDNLFLLHTRLAIQDIKNGKQPFSFKHWTIVFNGEIYNHRELRDIYLKDFNFLTDSDTETLLYLYIKFKEKMFDKIDGMFAFAIYDNKEKILFLARDRAGKKPLYFYQNGNIFFFASELNAFSFLPNLQIDEQAIETYLRCGFFPFQTTCYKNVFKLRNGHYAIYDMKRSQIKEHRFFSILDYYKTPKISEEKEILDSLESKLDTSVKDRLLSSDLEVGAFLSGGIDSSLIVAIASKHVQKLKTSTVKFKGAYDESHLARLTAQKYATDHHEIEITMDLKNDIEKILTNYGMPFFDSSAIPSYYVSKEAKKHLTVILNGDGADELFAGYRRYVPIANNTINIAKNFSFLTKILPKPNNKKSYYNYLYRLLSMSSKKGIDFYLSATSDIFEDIYTFSKNNLIKSLNEYIQNILNDKELTNLSKMLYLDFELILFSDLLVKMDIATMANSLEGRSPFLSKYMLEFAPKIDDNLKIKKLTTKYILRQLAEKYLPADLINQPKRGFEVPLKDWVNKELREFIFDYLQKGCYSENFIKRNFIDNLLNKKVRVSEEKRAKMLWAMVCLEVWKSKIYDTKYVKI